MDQPTVSFACGACGKKFSAPARFAGRSAKCAACGAAVTVPGKPADPFADLIGFGCRLCGTRMHAPSRHIGRKAKCPDCETLTVVPERPPPAKSRRPGAMDGEQYEVYEGEQPHGVDLLRAAPPTVSFTCRGCQTVLSAEARQAGESVVCHDCGATIRVPTPREPPPRKAEAAAGPADDDYDMAEEEAAPVTSKQSLFDAYVASAPIGYRRLAQQETDDRRRDDLDEEPATNQGWGVGLFAGWWRAFSATGMLLAWLGLTFGLFFTVPMAGTIFALLESVGGVYGWIGTVLMMATVVITTFIWVAVASAIFWAVLDDAASGARRVRGWPSIDPTEWGVPTLTLVLAGVVSAIPGTLADKLLLNALDWPWPLDSTWGWIGCGALLTLPIVLLSQLDEGSPWCVVSPQVLRTIWYAPVTWLAFFAVSAGLQLGPMWLATAALDAMGPWAVLVLCPLEVISDLAYFWLLGRLAWIAGAATPTVTVAD
ncbi:hypothetical protein Pla108_25930 [Botrimarina colliarenosi]|uniref:Double zinc ribbon n=1 Tax=Botrimarina colliarenosi TaxID=2528001 RepID=A0A5C6AB67_9BACT|nr:hypothetical protein [Botrimarina colliarenosi]TWT96819.1 hypothetical protein Pla108_25930 [Botrimarina colliarenosi]